MRNLTIASVAGLSLGLSLATLSLTENPAHACGGCFSPPDQITTVDSHRMVVSLGIEESILWDQIEYSGDPEEFVWVLPVPTPEVSVELAEAGFFEALDSLTAPSVQPASPPPQLFCPVSDTQSYGCGAAQSADFGNAVDGGVAPPVIVYDRDVVGPYETVTIGAEDPNALYSWLEQHNYAITQESLPAIEHYVTLGHAFIVLRLRPDVGVDAMQPIRVRYPGFLGTFPLKMVVVGAQGVLDLSLWIVAEQRYEARNYGTVEINEAELAWDWAASQSNYRDVFAATIERAGGRAWVVEYANNFDNLPIYDFPDDVTAVRNNMPAPYITRLRTSALVEYIDQDLELAPAAVSLPVDNFFLAPIDVNRPADVDCGNSDSSSDGIYCTVDTSNGKGAAVIAMLMALGVMVVTRRRRKSDIR